MKVNAIILLLLPAFIFAFAFEGSAQQCKFRKSDCELETETGEDIFADYDYRSQSAYAQLSPGDKQEIRFVVYRDKDYQVFTCQDFELGDVQFQIIKPVTRTERVIDRIDIKEEDVPELDEYGEQKYDENYNPIFKGKRKLYDTIWKTNRFVEEVVWFDSHNNDKGTKIWKFQCDKTTTLRARIIVPDGDPEYLGCVSVLIGFRQSAYKKFTRGSTSATGQGGG